MGRAERDRARAAHRRGTGSRAARRCRSPNRRPSCTRTASRSSRRARRRAPEDAVAAAEAIGYPGRPQAPEPHDHAQDRRRGRAPRPARRAPRSGRPITAIEASVSARHGAGHFEGVSVQPMIGRRWHRAHHRQQRRSAVRAGAPVRARRRARRGVPRPRARPAAPDDDARAPDDGAHARPSRRSRASAGGARSTSRPSSGSSSA